MADSQRCLPLLANSDDAEPDDFGTEQVQQTQGEVCKEAESLPPVDAPVSACDSGSTVAQLESTELHKAQAPQVGVTCVNMQHDGFYYLRRPPNDYFGLSLFTCVCCFWPLGLAALIFSRKVRNDLCVCL